MEIEEERNQLASYLNNFITAIKPNIELPKEIEHPSSKIYDDIDVDLSNLVSKLQEHECREEYCLKSGECKFGYPKKSSQSGHFVLIDNNWTFLPERNALRTVPYNSDILRSWRCNMDITVVSSTEILTTYLTKYVTKSNQSDLMSTM